MPGIFNIFKSREFHFKYESLFFWFKKQVEWGLEALVT